MAQEGSVSRGMPAELDDVSCLKHSNVQISPCPAFAAPLGLSAIGEEAACRHAILDLTCC